MESSSYTLRRTDNVIVTPLQVRQQGRFTSSADAVPAVRAIALVYNHYRATVTVLQSTADGYGCLKRIGLVVACIHSRAVTVTDYYQELLFAGKHMAMLISTGKEEERLALAKTTGLLNLGGSRVALYRRRDKGQGESSEYPCY